MAKIDLASVSYIIGILSIVLAFFNPVAGLILGVIGFVHSKKNNVPEARRLNVIGIVIGLVFIVLGFAVTYSCIINPNGFYCQSLFPTA